VLSQQESSRKDPDSDREVFRGPGSMVLSWAWLLVAVIILVDLAVQGRDHAAAVTAALVVVVSGIVYACAWRPRIVADSGGITIANPLRDHRVPWSAVAKVDVVNAVRVHCVPAPGTSRAKVIYSWAVQSSPRSARKASLRAERGGQRPRLSPRPRSLGPPPGSVPRYGEMPDSAKEALDRSSTEFTAGRLAERAQHARQAAATAAGPRPDGEPSPGTLPDGDRAGAPAHDARPDGEPGAASPAMAQAGAGQVVVRWAWPAIAAMLVPVVLFLVVLLV